MKRVKTTVGLVGVLLLVGGFVGATPSFAQGHGHAGMMPGMKEAQHQGMSKDGMSDMTGMSPHRGSMYETGEFRFETVFTESDVRVYVFNAAGKMISPKGIEGTVMIQRPDGEEKTIPLELVAGSKDPVAANRVRPGSDVDVTLGYLSAPGDFQALPDGAFDAHIMLKNIPGKEVKTAHWMAPYQRVPLFGMACPMHPDVASLEDGTCPKCGGMKLQAANIFYECCDSCGEMRMTSPGTCYKCGMELQPKAVDYKERMEKTELTPEEPRTSEHSH